MQPGSKSGPHMWTILSGPRGLGDSRVGARALGEGLAFSSPLGAGLTGVQQPPASP